jgi:hypothetical protein
MRRQTRLALVGAATAIVVAIGGAGIASATDIAQGNNPLSNLLGKLVGNGTITQNQADAIVKAADEDHAAHEAERTAHQQAKQDAIATAIGLDWSTIQTRLQNGETLASIAGDKKDALIKALVALEEQEIAQRVKDGVLTEEQATQIKNSLTDRITAMVNGTFGPRGGMGMGPRGMGDHDGDGPDDDFGEPRMGGHRGHHGGFGDGGFGGSPMGIPGSGSDA